MKNASSHRFKNMPVTPGFYPPRADLIRFRNRQFLGNGILLDPEFDAYSDLSVDTSSSLTFDSTEYLNYGIQAKKNRYFRPEFTGESVMQCGRSTFTRSESLNSPRWSEDEMSDFLPFDEMVRITPDMTVDEYGWCYPRNVDGVHLDFGRTLRSVPLDFIPTTSTTNLQSSNLDDNIVSSTDSIIDDGGLLSLYRDNTTIEINPNSNQVLPNPNSRNSNSEKRAQKDVNSKIRSIKIKKTVKGCTTILTPKKANKKHDKTKENDAQRVFLGGLPIGITERMLRQHLAALGYKVLKRPKILHGFAPEVWLKTVDQAKDLIDKGVIMIEGLEVEVRPYNSLTKLSELKKLPNVGRRSVFIGGLSAGTTTKDLQNVLVEMGMKVINYPVIKHGFARQVILDTIPQAKSLIEMKKIEINGVYGDVRPFVNQKRRRRTK